MRRINVAEARERFGELIDELRLDNSAGEEDGSFFLEQDGKPVGIVIGREGLHWVMTQQEEWMRTAIAEGEADLAAGRCTVLETDEDWENFFEGIKREGREEMAREGRECPEAAE